MKTIMQTINPESFQDEELQEACRILQNGGLVAFPTETVYGLGGDALRPEASAKIYEAKGRPSDNPLIVHIADMESLEEVAQTVPEEAAKLAQHFWPGPLTMIFPKKEKVPGSTTGGLDTVAVRMPSHPVARALIRESGVYIAAPSANTSGRPSPTKAEHVQEDLDGRIDMIIDGGAVGIGLESTIVDMSTGVPTILRPGYITKEMLEEVLGQVQVDPAILSRTINPNIVAKAPGMKYRHYAPKADLIIVEGEAARVREKINELVRENLAAGKKAGVIGTDESLLYYKEGDVRSIGSRKEEITIAQHLYSILRDFDESDISVIYSESFETPKIGQAIMNRLIKAAGHQIIKV